MGRWLKEQTSEEPWNALASFRYDHTWGSGDVENEAPSTANGEDGSAAGQGQ